MVRVFNKFKPLNTGVIYQTILPSDSASFLTHRFDKCPKYRASQTSLKFGFLVYNSSTLWRFFVRFFYLIFWNVIKLFARFSKYWSHNHCIWFVLWWKHRKWKHADFRLSFTRWRCLFHQGTFLFLLCSSNTSLE